MLGEDPKRGQKEVDFVGLYWRIPSPNSGSSLLVLDTTSVEPIAPHHTIPELFQDTWLDYYKEHVLGRDPTIRSDTKPYITHHTECRS